MKKLLNKKGFTLMEMMIVIAIIVVLVAISIPTFSGSLDKANAATDAANFRAAKSVVINKELAGETLTAGMEYDYETADFVAEGSGDNGKCTEHKGAKIVISASGEAVWSNGATCSGAN